jgi:two-component system OmpR family response regulator
VDDDETLSGMLKEYLENEGFVIKTSNNGADALERAEGGFAAIILDVMMPGMSGIDVLRQLRQKSSTPILMLTAKGDEIDRVVGLELGADDYIAKPYYAREVVARLRAVLRRHQSIPDAGQPLTFDGLLLDSARRSVSYAGDKIEVTATEFAILQMLMRNGEAVSSKADLSVYALGRKHETYDRSVDVHVSNLRIKLTRASKKTILIDTCRGVGYRLVTED